jgi:hypothetical protein
MAPSRRTLRPIAPSSFLIRDTETGSVLSMGRVTGPKS